MYDILADKENIEAHQLMSKDKALMAFPILTQEGRAGAMAYHHGQHNATRMNMALAKTAVQQGATIA
ncbi:hypothetical protein BC835DRAFT_1242473, partial [Cytidiella melzeri]